MVKNRSFPATTRNNLPAVVAKYEAKYEVNVNRVVR